ncbi:MAG: caspase family protein [Magnetococcales bacterium]|nr:caspase family protein [Magnetococcales bacterium]
MRPSICFSWQGWLLPTLLLLLSALTGCLAPTKEEPPARLQQSKESPPAQQEPPARPLLRLESGMHTAAIRHIDVDRAERWLVTASHDKTARVWNLQSGELLTTLRPPIGESGEEGKLYAVAISPDGETVAVGGWTGWQWGNNVSLYLFNRANGLLTRRIAGLPNVINHLRFSPDGQYLAVGLGGANGVRVYRLADGKEVFADREYGGSSFGVDFDPHGRLVTASDDGHVRLYDASFRKLAQVQPSGGKEPFGVAFSPDGQQVAVGFRDSTAVNLLSGQELRFLHAPDTQGLDGHLASIAWSRDGTWLYAAGTADSEGKRMIRRWGKMGQGSARDFPVAENTITHLRSLANGSVVFATGEPAWGVLNRDGKLLLSRLPDQADLRGQWEKFLLAADGKKVRFGLAEDGKHPVEFDLNSRQLSQKAAPTAGLHPPRMEAAGMNITGWMNTQNPQLDGQRVDLVQYERSRSLAIAPDGKRFLLGTEWFLRCFDQQGKALWQKPVPGVAWAVNISQDGRVAVVGYGDGTVRWHRMQDGQELLALFVTKDGRRWVQWTPQGYYAASPGAEELLGWHLNRGKEREAAFFPVARFREQFSRPDVVTRVLDSLDEAQALAQADAALGNKSRPQVKVETRLPPVVRLLAPGNGDSFSSARVTLRYRLESPSDAPVNWLIPHVDGRPLVESGGLERIKPEAAEGEVTLTLPERDLSLALIAENRHGFSEPAQLRLQWQGGKKSQMAEDGSVSKAFVAKPNLYVLAIGVQTYRSDKLPNLKYPVKDAEDFVRVIKKQERILYQNVEIKSLPNATRDEVLNGLEWLERQTTAKDVAMLFLSGHGVNDRNGYYHVPPA